MHIHSILKQFGLSEKEIAVFTSLIELGPSPVRMLAHKSGVNRGTTYDILKSLISQGLVSYYDKDSHQYFAAESPEKLLSALRGKKEELNQLERQIQESMPEMKLLFERQGGKPAVKMYEGLKGIRQILEDVLDCVGKSQDKQYRVYSSSTVRKNVHEAMPDFSQKRIKKKISVCTIALGEGGQIIGLDERKWMPVKGLFALGGNELKSTYEIIYAGKVAHVSLDSGGQPVGVVVENPEIYETQKLIFEFLWSKL